MFFLYADANNPSFSEILHTSQTLVPSLLVSKASLISRVKCIFKFYLARVNSIPVEFTSAWIFPSSFYKILLQMIPCLCRRRIK